MGSLTQNGVIFDSGQISICPFILIQTASLGVWGWLIGVCFSQTEAGWEILTSKNNKKKEEQICRSIEPQRSLTAFRNRWAQPRIQPPWWGAQAQGELRTNHGLSAGNNPHFCGQLTALNCRHYWKLITMRVILAPSLSSIEVMETMKEPLGIFA